MASRPDGDFIDGLLDFFALYVQKVHSDEFIRKGLKLGQGTSFLDFIGPNNIAYVIAVFKNGTHPDRCWFLLMV